MTKEYGQSSLPEMQPFLLRSTAAVWLKENSSTTNSSGDDKVGRTQELSHCQRQVIRLHGAVTFACGLIGCLKSLGSQIHSSVIASTVKRLKAFLWVPCKCCVCVCEALGPPATDPTKARVCPGIVALLTELHAVITSGIPLPSANKVTPATSSCTCSAKHLQC